MSKTKVWIIGAKGRLGSTISDALDRMAYNVLTSDMDVDITCLLYTSPSPRD